MWGFWAGVAALSALAALFVLYPAYARPRAPDAGLDAALRAGHRMRRDELQRDVEAGWLDAALFVEAEEELDRALLSDLPGASGAPEAPRPGRRAAWALAALVVAAALALLPVSSPLVRLALFAPEAPHSAETSALRLAELRARAERTPDDAAVWMELGAVHRLRGESERELDAWRRAVALTGGADADALVGLADAMAVAAGDAFAPEAVAHLRAALRADPDHPKALWLAGWAAWQREDAGAAHRHWSALRAGLPEEAAAMRAMVDAWLERLPAPAGPSLRVRVTLAPALAAELDPDATLFVYARRTAGPPMPLAIWRGTASALPAEVLLSDRLALAPGAGLASADAAIVVARVSRSGQAQLQSGDLVGETGPVALGGAGEAAVVIDRVAP